MQNEGSTHLHVQHLLRQTPLGILQPLAHHFYLLGGVVEPCLQGGDCRRGEQPSVIPFVNFVTTGKVCRNSSDRPLCVHTWHGACAVSSPGGIMHIVRA